MPAPPHVPQQSADGAADANQPAALNRLHAALARRQLIVAVDRLVASGHRLLQVGPLLRTALGFGLGEMRLGAPDKALQYPLTDDPAQGSVLIGLADIA